MTHHELPGWAHLGTEYAYGARLAHGTSADYCDEPLPADCECGHAEHSLAGCDLCGCRIPWTHVGGE